VFVFCCLSERSNRTTPRNAMSNPQHVGKRVACVRSLFTFLLFNDKISSRDFQYIRTSKSRYTGQFSFLELFFFSILLVSFYFLHESHTYIVKTSDNATCTFYNPYRNCLLHVTKYKLKFTSSSKIMYSKRSLTLRVAVVVVTSRAGGGCIVNMTSLG